MKRRFFRWGLATVGALAIGLSVTPSEALVNCLDPCADPPCEMRRQVALSTLLRNYFKSKRNRAAAQKKSADPIGQYNALRDAAQDMINHAGKKLPSCGKETVNGDDGKPATIDPDVPGMVTESSGGAWSSCKISFTVPTGKGNETKDVPLDDPGVNGHNYCREVVRAEHLHESHHADECELHRPPSAYNSDGSTRSPELLAQMKAHAAAPATLDTLAGEDVDAYGFQSFSLQQAMSDNAKKACTNKPDKRKRSPARDKAAAAAAGSALDALGGAK